MKRRSEKVFQQQEDLAGEDHARGIGGFVLMKYHNKLCIIEAVQFTGKNDAEVIAFCPTARDPVDKKPNLIILTRLGERLCSVGDWVIKDGGGEFYPCGPRTFEATYEKV